MRLIELSDSFYLVHVYRGLTDPHHAPIYYIRFFCLFAFLLYYEIGLKAKFSFWVGIVVENVNERK